jgi:hypothetical protein
MKIIRKIIMLYIASILAEMKPLDKTLEPLGS